jgi:hypothetical protein
MKWTFSGCGSCSTRATSTRCNASTGGSSPIGSLRPWASHCSAVSSSSGITPATHRFEALQEQSCARRSRSSSRLAIGAGGRHGLGGIQQVRTAAIIGRAFFSSMPIAVPAFLGDHGSPQQISIRLHHSLQWSLRATAKQSGAAERSLGRDCFVAQSAPHNDSANLIGICSNSKKLS